MSCEFGRSTQAIVKWVGQAAIDAGKPPPGKHDRAGRECLLRYCARPPFALERLRELDPERFIYDHPKADPGARAALLLTPLERLDRIAALVPPPRIHRHRYFGVLAANLLTRNHGIRGSFDRIRAAFAERVLALPKCASGNVVMIGAAGDGVEITGIELRRRARALRSETGLNLCLR